MIKVRTLTSWGLVARCGLSKFSKFRVLYFIVVISGEGVSPGQQRGHGQVRYDFSKSPKAVFRSVLFVHLRTTEK